MNIYANMNRHTIFHIPWLFIPPLSLCQNQTLDSFGSIYKPESESLIVVYRSSGAWVAKGAHCEWRIKSFTQEKRLFINLINMLTTQVPLLIVIEE